MSGITAVLGEKIQGSNAESNRKETGKSHEHWGYVGLIADTDVVLVTPQPQN